MYKIKNLLILTVSSMLILIISILSFTCYYFFETTMLITLSKNRQDSLQLVCQKTDSMISGVKTISNLLYRDQLISGTLSSDDISLLNLSSIRGEIDQIYLKYYESFRHIDLSFQIMCFGENGFRYSSQADYKEKNFEVVQSYSWFTKNKINKTDSYLVANFIYPDGRHNNSINLAFVKNLFSSNGEYTGSILVYIPEETISNVFMDLVHDSNEIYLLDDLSVVISCNDKTKIGTMPFQLPDYRFIRSEDTYSIYKTYGQTYYCAKYQSPKTGWTVLEQIPLDIVLLPVHELLNKLVVLAIVFCILSVILSVFISRQISRPLQLFSKKIGAAVSNNFEAISMKTNLFEIVNMSTYFNQLTQEVKSLMTDIKKTEQDANNAKFKFLKAQINPHFLYNTLFSIKCVISMGQPKKACEMITILVSLLRNSISSNDDEISLIDETAYLSQYVKLQNLRYNDTIQLKIILPDSLIDVHILRFIVQPLVENAIVHNMPGTNGNGNSCITINFEDCDADIIIEVCDNGKGFTQQELISILNKVLPQDDTDTSLHIALKNIHDRIRMHYGDNYGLFIKDDNNYSTVICIRLPKKF